MLINKIGEYEDWPDPFFVKGRSSEMQLSDVVRKCVAFIGIKEHGRFIPKATAFFVSYREGQHYFDHLVTAEHVISGLMTKGLKAWLRVNLTNGTAREVEINYQKFRYHPNAERDATDVAVCPFNRRIDLEDGGRSAIDITPIGVGGDGDNPNNFAAPDDWMKSYVGLGTEIAIIGLFRSHFGKERNIPILRVGNLSAMPEEPVKTKYAGYVEAYLIEARSIAGLSGSPVIAVPDAASLALAQLNSGKQQRSVCLLGLMHGHFDVVNLNEDVVAEQDEETTRGIHTGIGVVIPVKKIMETLEQPELVKMRKAIIARLLGDGATADVSAIDEACEQPKVADGAEQTSANPSHQEDFMRLVDAAARKKPPAG